MIDKARIKSAVDAATEALADLRLNGTESSDRGKAIAQLAGQIVLGERIADALKQAAEIGRIS